MCKSLLRIKCTNFEPKKAKIQELDAFKYNIKSKIRRIKQNKEQK